MAAAPFLMRDPEGQRIPVKRDGGRGWHWIAAASYNPAIHERLDVVATVGTQQPEAAAVEQQPAKRRPGRPKKHPL